MSEAYTGEIRIFGGNFAPQNWAFCNGQLLSIASNSTLFAIIGNTYGGDGKTTFALPNLSGRAAIHQGTGAGLTPRNIGTTGGSATVTLLTTEMPSHHHLVPLVTMYQQQVMSQREQFGPNSKVGAHSLLIQFQEIQP